jgi:diketogulonate reductase-like aldo/keto reductase
LQAYSPLVRGKMFKDLRLLGLAKKYNKTPAQIILRWDIQLNVSPIPKSANPQRLKENFDIFDFSISEEDMQLLNSFHEKIRVAEDPMNYL